MRMAKVCGTTRLVIYGDSSLVVQQMMNECDAHATNMIAYHALYNSLEGDFDSCELQHVGREGNKEADRLANIGSTCARVPPGVFLEQIYMPSIKRKFPKGSPEEAEHSGAALLEGQEGPEKLDTEVAVVNLMQVMAVEETWTQPYLRYLINRELPDDPTDARRISRRSKAFTIINGELYAAFRVYFNGASPSVTAKPSSKTSMRASAAITRASAPSPPKLYELGSTGQRP